MLLRALSILLALVFALPACFTSAMWRNVSTDERTGPVELAGDRLAASDAAHFLVFADAAAVTLLAKACPDLPPAGGWLRVAVVASDLERLRQLCRKDSSLRPTLVVHEDERGIWTDIVCSKHDQYVRLDCSVALAGAVPRIDDREAFAAIAIERRVQTTRGLLVTRAVLLTPFTLLLDVVLGIVFCPFLLMV
jgi:hypothetical protein